MSMKSRPVLLAVAVALGGWSAVVSAQPTPGSASSFRAVGNEPGWTLDIGAARMQLVADYGATRADVPTPAAVRIEGGRRFEARTEAHTLVVTILDRVCADTMTGMPRPATVEVSFDGRLLKGCGGDPTSLLRGGTWLVESLSGQPLIALSKITMVFAANGRITGNASCNAFSAGYLLTGESLTVTMPIAAMRTCAPPFMAQEAAFLEVLRGVTRFAVGEDGALTLQTLDGGTIVARKEVPVVVQPTKPAKPR
jgi:heat shock protein HslJ